MATERQVRVKVDIVPGQTSGIAAAVKSATTQVQTQTASNISTAIERASTRSRLLNPLTQTLGRATGIGAFGNMAGLAGLGPVGLAVGAAMAGGALGAKASPEAASRFGSALDNIVKRLGVGFVPALEIATHALKILTPIVGGLGRAMFMATEQARKFAGGTTHMHELESKIKAVEGGLAAAEGTDVAIQLNTHSRSTADRLAGRKGTTSSEILTQQEAKARLEALKEERALLLGQEYKRQRVVPEQEKRAAASFMGAAELGQQFRADALSASIPQRQLVELGAIKSLIMKAVAANGGIQKSVERGVRGY